MDYLTLDNRGTPEQFLDMFSQKISKTELLPNCISFNDDISTELTYDIRIFGELLQLAYTSGYVRGKKGKTYDLRESKDMVKHQEIPKGVIGKYYFEEDNEYSDSIGFFNSHYERMYNKIPFFQDKRGKFVYLFNVNSIWDLDGTMLICLDKGYSDFWVAKDCVVML